MGELIWDPNGAYLLFKSANRLQMPTVRGVTPPCPTDLPGARGQARAWHRASERPCGRPGVDGSGWIKVIVCVSV